MDTFKKRGDSSRDIRVVANDSTRADAARPAEFVAHATDLRRHAPEPARRAEFSRPTERAPRSASAYAAPFARSMEVRTRPADRRLRPSDNHIYFEAVARHGSIRKAAEHLHIASSALNRRILDLEEEVGSPLFERLPRGVRLTGAGEVLVNYVRWSLKELRKVEAQIDQLQGEARGAVRIAVAESVTPSLLPAAIADYHASHPGVGFHVLVDGPEVLVGALLKDHVDLILTHEPPQQAGLSVLAVTEHPLCAFVAPDHPLAAQEHVSLRQCAQHPCALPDHTLAARQLLDAALDEAGVALLPALESDSIETLKASARLGRMVCFSFHLGSDAETQGLVPLVISHPRCAEAQLFLAARRGRVLPVAAASFAEGLGEALRKRIVAPRASVA